jgi:hypothetical protein
VATEVSFEGGSGGLRMAEVALLPVDTEDENAAST